MKRFHNLSILLFLCAASLLAQIPNVVSPEVHDDTTATFRVYAPKAEKVLLLGDWLKRGEDAPMTKGGDGVWTAKAGPLPPGAFIYGFEIDGLQIPDPSNASVKIRADRVGSLVHIPGDAVWAARDVPHGNVDINFHKSAALGDTRWMFVYTPASYDVAKNRSKTYPVLYLLHGNNDTAAGWTMVGNANYILDNLIAEAKAQEMIVVMPFGHAAPYGAPGGTNTQQFTDYLLKDVIPMIEGKYRVKTGAANLALVGLSMGGGQAINIGFSNLDKFSVVGSFSGAIPGDFETHFASELAKPDLVNRRLALLWIGCGKDDFLHQRNQEFSALLKAKGIKHTLEITEGVHNYEAWRRYLA
ncbi:MAG: alpha/beta hydrolase-fold protein [Acidobacteria bacterium]|nr:alpha/beta hydrolase-fold protein [Acidobacteriota bacterium]